MSDFQVDRVAIWNKRFGPQDFVTHWKKDFDPTNEPDLLAYWRFNEGTGTNSTDVASGINIELSGTQTWVVSGAPMDVSTTTAQTVSVCLSVCLSVSRILYYEL